MVPSRSPRTWRAKKVGIVPTSGEAPYFPAYLKLVGVDESTITHVALDVKVLEQTLINGSVDAITMFGVSSIPVFVTQKFPSKSLLYSSAGLPFYQLSIITRPDFLQKNESLVANFIEGLMEGVKFSLVNPEETLKLHMKGTPELAATDTGEEYARLGMGITQVVMLADEAMKHSIGYGDMAVIEKQISTIKRYVAAPEDRVPKAADIYTNKYIGNSTLTASQWDQVKANNKNIVEIMGKS
jgi:NitT/TauT family transport system substrate-binding protein